MNALTNKLEEEVLPPGCALALAVAGVDDAAYTRKSRRRASVQQGLGVVRVNDVDPLLAKDSGKPVHQRGSQACRRVERRHRPAACLNLAGHAPGDAEGDELQGEAIAVGYAREGAKVLIADRLNRFQFLTIRRYLTLVFLALVTLLLVLALWP